MIFAIFLLSTIACTVSARAIDFRLPDGDIPEETNAEKFTRSDANHNDELTFDEFLHTELVYELMKRDEFDRYDANNDGIVSRTEFEGRLKQEEEKNSDLRAQYFGKIYEDFDENFDMKLSEEEVRKVLAERFLLTPRQNFHVIFESFDTNGDGGLDIQEYLSFDENVPFDQMDPIAEATETPTITLKKEKLPMMKADKNEVKF